MTTPVMWSLCACLRKTLGLMVRLTDKATDVVISGVSAGALAVYLTLDRWCERLREVAPSATCVGLPDSGFFLDYQAPGVTAQPPVSDRGSVPGLAHAFVSINRAILVAGGRDLPRGSQMGVRGVQQFSRRQSAVPIETRGGAVPVQLRRARRSIHHHANVCAAEPVRRLAVGIGARERV